jgi:hypothetical protein
MVLKVILFVLPVIVILVIIKATQGLKVEVRVAKQLNKI